MPKTPPCADGLLYPSYSRLHLQTRNAHDKFTADLLNKGPAVADCAKQRQPNGVGCRSLRSMRSYK
jgi:hypothetical protein